MENMCKLLAFLEKTPSKDALGVWRHLKGHDGGLNRQGLRR